jgi:hypothetical protein
VDPNGCEPMCILSVSTQLQPFSGINILSGICFLLFGWLAATRLEKRSLSLGLASFLMAWGIQVILLNLANYAEGESKASLQLLSHFFFALQPVTLLYFVSLHPDGRVGPSKWKRVAFSSSLIAAGFAFASSVLLLLKPEWLVGDGKPLGTWAPYLLELPGYGGLALGMLFLIKIVEGMAPVPASPRMEHKLLAGLWLAIGFQIFRGFSWLLGGREALTRIYGIEGVDIASTTIFAFSTVVLLVAGFRWFQIAPPRLRPLVAAFMIATLLWGLSLALIPNIPMDSVYASPGLARIVSLVPLIAYAFEVKYAPDQLPLPRSAAPLLAIPILAILGNLVLTSLGIAYSAMITFAAGILATIFFLFSDRAAPIREARQFLRPKRGETRASASEADAQDLDPATDSPPSQS